MASTSPATNVVSVAELIEVTISPKPTTSFHVKHFLGSRGATQNVSRETIALIYLFSSTCISFLSKSVLSSKPTKCSVP